MRSAKEQKEMSDYLRDKSEKNRVVIQKNMDEGVFVTPYKEGDVVINGRVLSDEEKVGLMSGKYELENSITKFNNRLFKDPMTHEEMEEGDLTFGGKKVRRSTKNTKKKRGGRIKRRGQKTRRGIKNKVKKTRRGIKKR